jgi:hypothetical protein
MLSLEAILVQLPKRNKSLLKIQIIYLLYQFFSFVMKTVSGTNRHLANLRCLFNNGKIKA